MNLTIKPTAITVTRSKRVQKKSKNQISCPIYQVVKSIIGKRVDVAWAFLVGLPPTRLLLPVRMAGITKCDNQTTRIKISAKSPIKCWSLFCIFCVL
jgi:hypothetical protein